jgi:hypothetical protein
VQRLFLLTILAIILAGLILFSLSDAAISIADTGTPHNEVTSSVSKASNSSASATITITMYAVADE